MDVETADQLRAKIAAAQTARRQEDERTVRLLQEVEEAKERQSLRNELSLIERGIENQRDINRYHNDNRMLIDRGRPSFLHDRDYPGHGGKCKKGDGKGGKGGKSKGHFGKVAGAALHCNKEVHQGNFSWEIKGMSWLVHAMAVDSITPYARSPAFSVGDEPFRLVYNPEAAHVDINNEQCGSLAIQHLSEQGITFKYRLYVKHANGEFSQWGDPGDECHPDWDTLGKAFGPDVLDSEFEEVPSGIFGLSHEALLKSDWVQNDSLHVKAEIEVRTLVDLDDAVERYVRNPAVDVPPSALGANMLSALNTGEHSDVTFAIEEERIKAHAVILCVRSAVFARLLRSGLHESRTREIVIEDTDIATFKLLLKFLYTDNLSLLEDDLRNCEGYADASLQISMRQSLLAVSHKYEIVRLQAWCEQQLVELVSASNVCSILCQAHLYEAKSLEQICLAFIKDHFGIVAKQSAFGSLSETWPEVMLKINFHMANLSENDASDAIKAQQEARRKRQRLESHD